MSAISSKRQSGEVALVNQPRIVWRDSLKLCQRAVEVLKIDISRAQLRRQFSGYRRRLPLRGPHAPDLIDQDLSHHTGGQGEEMRAPLELQPFKAGQTDHSLMRQIGGLDPQRCCVSIQHAASDTAKLVVVGAQQCVPRRAYIAGLITLPVRLGHLATPLRNINHAGRNPAIPGPDSRFARLSKDMSDCLTRFAGGMRLIT